MEEPRDDLIEEIDQPSSARRTLSLRNNMARQVAVNFMPSRQLPYNTLRLRRTNSEHNALLEEIEADPDKPAGPDGTDGDGQADRIVREMEQHTRLMEDDPAAEELRREALRDLPQGLTMKRHVRAKLSASVSLRSKRRPISMWKRFKYRTSFAWKRAQDRFRDFIFSIELWYAAIRNIEGQYGSAVGSYFYFLRWLFSANVLLSTFVIAFVVVPQAMHDRGTNETTVDAGWGLIEFLSGRGGYANSLLFYGHYHDGDIASGGLPYNMAFAYFFTMSCLYFLVFAVLCFRTAYSYRRNFIETSGGLSHVYANKLFCGWDFRIVSPQAAALNATTLYNEFKELLNEQNKNNDEPTLSIKLGRNLTNMTINILTLSMIVGLEYGFWMLLSVDSVTSRWEILLSLSVTTVIAVLPVLFNLIVKLEYYSPRTSLYVTLARTWLLDVGTLMVLFYYWTKSGAQCWETSFGQEAYRLVLLDSLVSLIILPAIEIVRYTIFKFYPKTAAPEFNIAYNSLTLIYNQVVVWFGMVFSPLLVVAVTIKFLLLFYLKRECALRCQPAGKIWRAAQTQTVMYMLVTLSLFTTMFGFGYLFLRMPSKHCGPFRAYDHVYQVLSEGVLRLSHHDTATKIILFVTRPGVTAFVILLLCVAVYYMRAKARAQHSMVGILRHMLLLQAKDKDFLLNAIAKVSNGEWLYSPKPDDDGPNSHTWKYLQEVRKPSNAGFHFDASRLSQRPKSYLQDRPGSYAKDDRRSDGETDSSFSWKGSNSCLDKDVEEGAKKLY